MSTFLLEIVTPERKKFSGEVEMVVVTGVEGEMGILARHIPLVTALKIAPVRIKTGKEEHKFAVNGGFVEIRKDKVVILAESAELPDEIDLDRAQAARDRAEQRLRDTKRENYDYARAELALKRAINRLNVVQ
jgi:F-type H+-transporting ATPase subunit epsilon